MRVALITVVAALAFVGSAQADAVFSDSTGQRVECGNVDLPYSDISTVAISNDPTAGTLTFHVSLIGAPPLTGTAGVHIALFQAGTTGEQPLHELAVDANGASLDGASGGGSSTSTYSGGVLSVTTNTSAVGSPERFGFVVIMLPSYVNHQTYCQDSAPDGGVWTYTMAKAATPPNAPTAVSATTQFSGTPNAGHVFSVTGLTARLSTGVTSAARNVTCTASLAHRAFKGSGAGGCTFTVPKTAKRKELVITATGIVGAETVTSTDSLTVK